MLGARPGPYLLGNGEMHVYKPWHDKTTGKTSLRYDSGKCLHYYFYFIDKEYGLCYLRVPTWCPFRLQFYFNGHNLLAAKLARQGIGSQLRENAFLQIDDWEKAQSLSDSIRVEDLHQVLDILASRYVPFLQRYGLIYRWSIMQAEYATDIVFKRQADLGPIYETLVRTVVHSVKPENIASFLGRKLHWNYQGETHAFSARESSTRWMRSQSRCTTSSGSSCALKQLPTMSPSSGTTVKSSDMTGAERARLPR